MLPPPRHYGCSLALSGTFFLFFGGLALISRLRMIAEINAVFKQWIGAEYQSWAEHFLSGLASPSVLFLFAVLFGRLLALFQNRQWNWKIALRAKECLQRQPPWTLFDLLLVFCCVAYITVSFFWEFSQYRERDSFQFGQFFFDVSGSVIWLLACRQCSLTWRSTSLPLVAGRCAINPRNAG